MTILDERDAPTTFSGKLAAFDDSRVGIESSEKDHFMKICKHFYRRGNELYNGNELSGRFTVVYDLLEEYDRTQGLTELPDRKLLEMMESAIGTTPLYILSELEIFDSMIDDNGIGNDVLTHLQQTLEMEDVHKLSMFLIKLYGLEKQEEEKIEVKPLPFPVEKANTEPDWFSTMVMNEVSVAKM